MVSPLRIGAIALGIAAVCCYGVWAGVVVRTGSDGSVTVVTDDIRVETDRGGSTVTTNSSSQSFSSQQHSSSSTHSSGASSSSHSSSSTFSSSFSNSIPSAHLSTRDYLLLVSGQGDGNVTVNGRTVGDLSDRSSFRLNSYLQPGNNTISMSGHGSTDFQLAFVEAEPGDRPYFSRAGEVVGARQVMMQQHQSRSGGDWRSAMVVTVR